MSSIYKTEEGRKTMAAWYDTFIDKLGRDQVSFQEVQTGYGSTNILIAGPEDAPPLWCFHGAMASAPAALYQIPSLLQRFKIYFPDTIGQPGRSDETRLNWQGDDHGRWMIDVLDAMEVESVAAIGVSLGGYVILRGASLAPERIHRAVLWVPGGLIKPSMRNMFGLIGAGLMYSLFPSQARLEAILSRTCTDLDDTFVSFFADSLRHVHPDRRFPNTLPDQALDGWAASTMLITHEHDTVFPHKALMQRAEAMIPHLDQVEIMKGWAHMPPFSSDDVDGLLDKIESFLTS